VSHCAMDPLFCFAVITTSRAVFGLRKHLRPLRIDVQHLVQRPHDSKCQRDMYTVSKSYNNTVVKSEKHAVFIDAHLLAQALTTITTVRSTSPFT
jgi:hypothetical protein